MLRHSFGWFDWQAQNLGSHKLELSVDFGHPRLPVVQEWTGRTAASLCNLSLTDFRGVALVPHTAYSAKAQAWWSWWFCKFQGQQKAQHAIRPGSVCTCSLEYLITLLHSATKFNPGQAGLRVGSCFIGGDLFWGAAQGTMISRLWGWFKLHKHESKHLACCESSKPQSNIYSTTWILLWYL